MKDWMHALADHYEKLRLQYPQDDLLILFDIDGTILDVRYTMLYLLRAYDNYHHTDFFTNRGVVDINFTIDELEAGLRGLGVPAIHFPAMRRWYEQYCWSMSAIMANRALVSMR